MWWLVISEIPKVDEYPTLNSTKSEDCGIQSEEQQIRLRQLTV